MLIRFSRRLRTMGVDAVADICRLASSKPSISSCRAIRSVMASDLPGYHNKASARTHAESVPIPIRAYNTSSFL